jgi:enediyne biosynthesis thioesterase
MNVQHRPKTYTYRHIISFEETNVVGNVYFARQVAWQGACREMFLRDHAPATLDEIAADLRLVTVRVACDYYHELRAFDDIAVHMTLTRQVGNRIILAFDYRVTRDGMALQFARGEQEIRSMREGPEGLAACPIPDDLARALDLFAGSISADPAILSIQ